MRRIPLLCAILLSLAGPLAAGILTPAPAPRAVPGLIVVKWRGAATASPATAGEPPATTADVALATLAADYRLAPSGLPVSPALHAQVFRVPAGADTDTLLAALRRDPRVAYAQPVLRRHALSLAAPNDPAYNNLDPSAVFDPEDATWFQWNMHTIDVVDAWRLYPGTYYTAAAKRALGSVLKAAVVDTGIDFGHPDFVNVGGTSGDARAGGQIDVADAHNYVPGEDPTNAGDEFGHGTHVAGIIGAATNDDVGVVGIAYNGQVMPVKVLDASGNGTDVEVANGITWAADHGAMVINLSLGDYSYSYPEEDAVEYAWSKGALIVAAAGNDGNTTPLYPADLPHVLAVSATGFDDSLASYSTYGQSVSVAAPGGDADYNALEIYGIYSTLPTYAVTINQDPYDLAEDYDYAEGTSAAAPHVAGIALLYAGAKGITPSTPGGNLRIWRAIQRGAAGVDGTVGGGWDPSLGYGRVDAYHTLLEDNPRGATVGCITGQVTLGGTPVPNARVTVSGTPVTATSAADGTFRLANLPAGTYAVTASALGRTVVNSGIPVVAGADTPGTFLALDTAASVPLYRLHNPYNGEEFYTANPDERRAVLGYMRDEGVAAQVFARGTDATGLVPLYRFYNPYADAHFWTANQTEKNTVSRYMRLEGVACYVFPAAGPGRIPLLRAYNPATDRHLFTTSQSEFNGLPSPWVREGTACYVLPAGP